MNGYERIHAALRGERPDKIPVMLHNFMMAARENGVSMGRFRRDGRAIAESFIRAVETYGYDGIVVDIDTTVLAGAVGVPVDYPDDRPARCRGPLLRSLEAVKGLEPVNIENDASVQAALEAVSRLRGYFQRDISVRGNCDQCPFSLAGSIRSLEEWMLDLALGDPELIHALLEYCTGVTGRFLDLMSRAGADILSNGDSPAGPEMISPSMYREFALPYEKRIAAEAGGLRIPYVLHICGNTDLIIGDMAGSGAGGLEVDQRTDVYLAKTAMGGRVAFIGNIDPSGVLALGTAETVIRKTRELLNAFEDTPRFILNAGCAIPAETPPENLRAMIRAARDFR